MTAAADGNSTDEEIETNNNNTSVRVHDVLQSEEIKSYKSKTVYLIRHAESEENVDMASLFDAAGAIRKFQLPRKQDTKRGLKFVYSCIAGNTDAPLSHHGKRQSELMGEVLSTENFLEKQQVKLIVHSPLIRARDTCQSMLLSTKAGDGDKPWRVEELECLREATPYEQVVTMQQSLRARISEFQRWLALQKEERIAVVGHSQYFRLMLGMSEKFQNCDIWEAKFICDEANFKTNSSLCVSPEICLHSWKDIQLVYRYSQLASA